MVRVRYSFGIGLLGQLFFLIWGSLGCGELGPIEPWEWCPGAEVFESPGGELTLEVGNRALYCAIPNVTEPATAFSSLSQLLLIEGTYRVPAETGSYSVRLPLCLKLSDQELQLTLEEVGTLRVDLRYETYGNVLRIWYDQNMQAPAGDPWLLTGHIYSTYEGELPPIRPDGSYESGVVYGAGVTFGLQGPAETWGTPLYGCGRASSANRSVQVSFPGGYVLLQLEVVANTVVAGVPIGFLRSASGSLDGETFSQADYWKLAFVGGHHGWVNDYYVRFDKPIGNVCGMWISDEQYPEFSAIVRLLDCQLAVLEER